MVTVVLRSPAILPRSLIKHWQRWKVQWILFLGSFLIYMANGRTIGSGDTLPASLWAFNLLENHTFHFDILRGSHFLDESRAGFFVEAANGHLTSAYPIGVAIITLPLYVVYFLWLKLQSGVMTLATGESVNLLVLTDPDFAVIQSSFEKLSAAILTAIAVVLFYQVTQLKFSRGFALGLTLLFAFATETWVISSQGLWQHGASNLAVITILYCLFQANRLEPGNRKRWLWVAGIACGLLPGIRPSSLLFAIATIGYAVITYRRESLYLLLGLPSAALSAAWNYYYFGNFLGAYSRFSSGASSFLFTLDRFAEGFSGLLFSPSRGLFIYTPVAIYALSGATKAFRFRMRKDEQLLAWLAIAALGIFVQYCFFRQWWAGWCYGPRFITDLLPIICLLIGYAWAKPARRQPRRSLSRISIALFLSLTIYSTAVQAIGAFGTTPWDAIPDSRVNIHTDFRLWGWRDSQIERHTRRLFYKWFPPIDDEAVYLSQSGGVIEQLINEEDVAIAEPFPMRVGRPKILKARLRNTGKTRWYGYETGMVQGIVTIQVRFFDAAGNEVKLRRPTQLYASGTIDPGQTTLAIGRVYAPSKPGTYRIDFDLQVNEVGEFPSSARQADYSLLTNVKPRANPAASPPP